MSVSNHSNKEDLAEVEFNPTEKQQEEDYWGKIEGDTDFDLPVESPERCGSQAGACGAGAKAATCNKTNAKIEHGMEVIASCGNRIGKVDHLDGDDSIKLMKHDSLSEGQHHWIPTSWVDHVDAHVHLNLNSQEAMNRWKNEEACEACSQ